MLSVEIRSWDFSFGDGIYHIQIVGEEQSFHDCTIHISGNASGCDEGGDCVLESTCNASYTSDSWVFVIESAPNDISIDVFKDEANYLSVDTVPVYEQIYPNGTDCEPTCLVGEPLSHHLIY